MRYLSLAIVVIFSLLLLPACKKKGSRSNEKAKRLKPVPLEATSREESLDQLRVCKKNLKKWSTAYNQMVEFSGTAWRECYKELGDTQYNLSVMGCKHCRCKILRGRK